MREVDVYGNVNPDVEHFANKTVKMAHMEPELRPRHIRPAPDPLGNYLRPGWTSHTPLLQLLSEDVSDLSGVVFDPCYDARHETLRQEVLRRGLEAVLDPLAMELATPGGFTTRRRELPWAADGPHRTEDLDGLLALDMVDRIASYCTECGFSAVLAPTHFLDKGPDDPWFAIDRTLTRLLRQKLNGLGNHDTLIYYPLAVPGKVFRDPSARERLQHQLMTLPVDSSRGELHSARSTANGLQPRLALRLEPSEFGTAGAPSGPTD